MNALVRQSFLPAEPSWTRAKQWLAYATKFEECKLASQVMLGFELIGLWRALGIKNGNNQHSPEGRVCQDGKGWLDEIESNLGIGHRTAYRFMDMARAVAEKKLQPFALIHGIDFASTPISALTIDQSDALSSAVKRICDQKTQRDFLDELGLADSAAEARAKGGDNEWKRWVKNHHPELLDELGIVPTRGHVKRSNKEVFGEWEKHQAELAQKRKDAQPTMSEKEAEAEAHISASIVRLAQEACDEIAGLCPEPTLKRWKQSLLGALDYLKEIEKARRIKL